MTKTTTSNLRATREAEPSPGPADFGVGQFALRNAWFPVIQTGRIWRHGVRRTIHGQPVHLWRDGMAIVASEDPRPERERGNRRESEFTAGGLYPVEQRYGYAWVWYGNPDDASLELIPNIPHIPLEGMPRHMQGSVIFDCSYELICENLLDLTHADYLHSALTGTSLSEDDEVTVTSTSETVTMTRRAVGRPVPKAQRRVVKADKQDFVGVTLVHVRSGVCVLHGNFVPGMSVRMIHPATPESPNRCRTEVSYNVINCSPIARHLFALASHWVGPQDNWAVRVQNVKYRDPVPQKDLSSRFDRAGVRYRRVIKDLIERQRNGDYSYLPDGDPARDVWAELGLDHPALQGGRA